MVSPGVDADATRVVSGGDRVAPGQRTSDDIEATTVIPPLDPDRR
ncbi:hypothetical protein [Micromonospora sp. NPDC005173]